MEKIALFYGSSTGNTEEVALEIQREFGKENLKLFNVERAKSADALPYEYLIFGLSTWGFGDFQDDFYYFLSELDKMDLQAKKVALFGLGDQDSYPETFANGLGLLYDKIKDKGCRFYGFTSTDFYHFLDSKAVDKDHFVGLVIDHDNQSELSKKRIKHWVEQVKMAFEMKE